MRKISSTILQLRPDDLVDRPTVGVATGEAGHRGLHRRAHLLQRGRARFGYCLRDGLLDLLARGGLRQILFDDCDLRALLVREFRAPRTRVLLDRVAPLLDERLPELRRLVIVERLALLA